MAWQQRIVSNSQVLKGRPTIRGTRISVEFVLSLLSSGWSPTQIVTEMPDLDLEDVHACLACSLDILRLLIGRDLHTKFLEQVSEELPRDASLQEETNDEN